MKEKEKNKKRSIAFLIVGVMVLLVAIIGAAYAYFQAQIGNGAQSNINALTGTTDSLVFNMKDIDAGEGNDYIIDEDKIEEGVDLTPIIINADQTNFGKEDTSLGDGVVATATLRANNTTNTAEATYNVFFAIDNNDLKYTTSEKKPELILRVTGPDGEVKKIEGLVYHDKDDDNPNDVSGFDITGKKHAYAIKIGQEIRVDDPNGEHQKSEEWKVEVIFVNIPNHDQNDNTNKTVNGKVIITTKDDIETYKIPYINTVDATVSKNSIVATASMQEKSTNEVKQYFFAIENQGVATIATETEKTKDQINDWVEESEPTHTFSGLEYNTNYIVYSYAVDSEGLESNLYSTEIVATDIKLPKISEARVTAKTYDSITVSVTSEPGSFAIKEYECSIKETATEGSPITKVETEPTCTFTELNELTEYEITIIAKDNKDNSSTEYNLNETTLEKTLGDICKNQEVGSCFTANAKKEPTLLHHNADLLNGANDDSYRYSGSNNDVNNYVCLDSSTGGTCADDDLYRIIGLFKASDVYEIKLIKSEPANENMLGKGDAYNSSSGSVAYYYWNSKTNSSNLWKDSKLYSENLNTTYLSYLNSRKDKITEHITLHDWITAGNRNISYSYIKDAYQNEIVNYDETGGIPFGKATEEDIMTQAQIGLLYVSDYGYAASQGSWTKRPMNEYGQDNIPSTNWLYRGLHEWTITRQSSFDDYAHFIESSGNIMGQSVYQQSAYVPAFSIRPTFYLESNTKIDSGNGHKDNPYRFKWDA